MESPESSKPVAGGPPRAREFACLACGHTSFEPGVIHAQGVTRCTFVPLTASRWRRWLAQGIHVRVRVCRVCGFVHAYADVEELDEATGEGHTRCRRCRYILKGISEPRCPECGEPI